MTISDDLLKQVTTGVSVVTGVHNGTRPGMTVNSFTSVSITPPMVSITLAHKTRTYALVERSKTFGAIVLGEIVAALASEEKYPLMYLNRHYRKVEK